MKPKLIIFSLAFGFWTAITLSGSVFLGFIFLNGPNSVTRLAGFSQNNVAPNLIVVILAFLCGGGLWGLGIARLMKADVKPIMISCALSWSATMIALMITVAIMATTQGVGFSKINFLPIFPHYRHYNFLMVFVTAVGIITAVNAYVVTGKFGLKQLRKSVGMYTGLAAALGFLATGLILYFGFGWEVGSRIPGMLTVLLICSIGGALTGGMALGWLLKNAKRHSLPES